MDDMAYITRLFTQVITVESCTGNDGYGAPQFGPPVAYRGRVVAQTRSLTTDRGLEVVSMTTVYLAAQSVVLAKDRITLPEGFDPRQPQILKVHRVEGSRGIHHTVVYC